MPRMKRYQTRAAQQGAYRNRHKVDEGNVTNATESVTIRAEGVTIPAETSQFGAIRAEGVTIHPVTFAARLKAALGLNASEETIAEMLKGVSEKAMGGFRATVAG